jgi:hypothetical protein
MFCGIRFIQRNLPMTLNAAPFVWIVALFILVVARHQFSSCPPKPRIF